jgi:D-glycerate 3-kinase
MVVNVHPAPAGFPAALVDAALAAALALPARVPVFALSGLQGTGKSTLAAQMAALAQAQGKHAVVVSLDDLYLPRAARQQLARQVHPLLATRGPPGTHDVALGCALLDALRAGEPVRLPRFDKLADDRLPPGQDQLVATPVDLVIVEGWCLGTPAEAEADLAAPINALEREDDAHGIWRRHCNRALARDYPALWQRFDGLWFLQPPGFAVVREWRWQQEQALAQARQRPVSMDRAGVDRFIQHFERVSRQVLRTLPALADRVIALDAERRPRS